MFKRLIIPIALLIIFYIAAVLLINSYIDHVDVDIIFKNHKVLNLTSIPLF